MAHTQGIRFWHVGVLLAVVSSVGCGAANDDNTAMVSGKVTLDGEPLESGDIRFYPTQGRMAIGQVVDGNYKLRTFGEDDGALIGSHTVTIVKMASKPRRGKNTLTDEELANYQGETVLVWVVPEKYSAPNKSPLTAEVQRGENSIDFALESK